MHGLSTRIESNVPKLIAAVLIVVGWGAVAPAGEASADSTFSCGVSGSGIPYCNYRGPVDKVYVNFVDTILFYPDKSGFTNDDMRDSMSAVGYEEYYGTVSLLGAFVVPATADPGWRDRLYATILAAAVAGNEVLVQLRGVNGSYMVLDRIWFETE